MIEKQKHVNRYVDDVLHIYSAGMFNSRKTGKKSCVT